MLQSLLVATRNDGKIAEYADMLADLKVRWLGLGDIGLHLEVAETGASFEENAILKARQYSSAAGLITLADDSGLEVDALQGRPGIYTARYGGSGLSPTQRYELILQQLEGISPEQRKARFRCVIALASPQRLIGTSKGVCEGLIAVEAAGKGGFGYDPIFYLPERGKTMAELPAEEKHLISHRGRAIQQISPLLTAFIADNSNIGSAN